MAFRDIFLWFPWCLLCYLTYLVFANNKIAQTYKIVYNSLEWIDSLDEQILILIGVLYRKI